MSLNLQEKANKARELKAEYSRAYEVDFNTGKKIELEYLSLRSQILAEVDNEIKRQRSIPIGEIKKRVEAMVHKPKRETGIRTLDYELVTDMQKLQHQMGGFSLGNYIQIAGERYAGKTSFMLKVLTNLSHHEQVCWVDFEMGERRVVQKLKDFTHDEKKLLYYNASRHLDEIIDEIKFLNASGVNHFVIDSTMKITIKNITDKYDRFSTISQQLSELTSILGINIYIINQMSQGALREGELSLKHGNDAEYDADYIFYILRAKKILNGKVAKDKDGFTIYDDSMRIIKCTKNREDDRLFSVTIGKSEIFSKPIEIEYEEN